MVAFSRPVQRALAAACTEGPRGLMRMQHRSFFNVNVDITKLFAERSKGLPVKLKFHAGGRTKMTNWRPENDSFSNVLQRLNLVPEEWEMQFRDKHGNINTVSGPDDIDELMNMREDKNGPIIVEVHQVEGMAAKGMARFKENLKIVKQAIWSLAAGGEHTPEKVTTQEAKVIKKVGYNPLQGATPIISITTINGVPKDTWKAYMSVVAKASKLPPEYEDLFNTAENQDGMRTSQIFPIANGMRRIALDVTKTDGKFYGAYNDCTIGWKARNSQISDSMIWRCDLGKGTRAFTVWPPPASIHDTACVRYRGTHTHSLPEGTLFVEKADPDFDPIKEKVAGFHPWGTKLVLVKDENDLIALGTKSSATPGQQETFSGFAQMDPNGRAVTLQDCSARLLIEILNNENVSEMSEMRQLMEMTSEYECAKIAPKRIEMLEAQASPSGAPEKK